MTDRLKIGQEVLIHGYIDEIRKGTIIIQNEGGYFGTVECEVTDIEMPNTNEVLDKIRDEMQKEKENIHFDLNEQKAKWVNSGIYDGLTWAQEIIDRYRKE